MCTDILLLNVNGFEQKKKKKNMYNLPIYNAALVFFFFSKLWRIFFSRLFYNIVYD